MGLDDTLVWYQKKIGAYDKDIWGRNLEQRILRGVSAIPKKTARIRAELIDIDLVRGSTFKKSKPQNSWLALATNGVVRVLLFPLYFSWWQQQTSRGICIFLLVLYLLQLGSLILHSSQDDTVISENTITGVLTPIAMMLVLGIMHAQVVATYTTNGQLKPIRGTKSKRPKRKTRSRCGYDGKSSPGTASEEKTESVWSEFQATRNSGGGSATEKATVRRRAKPERSLGRNRQRTQAGELPVQPDQLNLGPFQHRRAGGKNSDEESGLESLSNHNGPEDLCLAQEVQDKLESFLGASATGQDPGRDASALPPAAEREPSSDDEEFFVARKQRSRSHDVCCNDNVLFDEWRTTASTHASPHRPGSNECRGGRADASSAEDEEEDEEDKERPQRRRSSPPDLPPKPSVAPSLHARRRAGSFFATLPTIRRCEYNSSCESDKDTTVPNTPVKPPASDIEWPLLSNTDCNGYTSSSEGLDEDEEDVPQDPFSFDAAENSGPLAGGQTSLDKVSCTIWENGECKKVDLSVMDIASAIIHKVDCMIHSTEYVLLGLLLTAVTSTLPLLFRLQSSSALDGIQLDADAPVLGLPREVRRIPEVIQDALCQSSWSVSSTLLTICLVERFSLGAMFFFLLSVAERTFKQRFLYAKYFCHLTSARRALRSDLPHFRLNKVRNIKTWLSVRSYLKKHGPQRSVDVIVSTAFIIGVCILSFLCVQWLKENEQFAERLYCWEMVCWSMALGIFLMRFMILGSKINKKYRNLSVLITEQINLYLHMEQKPHKKEELMLANNVLKLAADLLKELESPFKISGLCANPYLYNITKVVCLSAFSAALTELFGFKLKLHKIKIK
ncbi:protein PHTF2 isoform X2 [Ixodes scapularis]|uniref:protein PHTF2 isoform X2 n=1 Tax=Ixodes scapularis TaxID=6945 RepID=UPI001A9F7EE7|nr:protein PHTF2 isoform X2 [Ixodes scapularis]